MVRRLVGLPMVLGAIGLLTVFAGVANASELPVISGVSATSVASEDATLNAEIEDHNEEATYRFEYGPADCTSSQCVSVPVPDGAVSASGSPLAVSQQLHYLTPGATYHYRVVAINAAGEQASGDHTFHPFALAGNFKLPDNRAWELVSPVDKNGGGVASVVTRTRAAANGNSVAYVSLAGFGDVEGMGTTAEYESVRDATPGTQGWSTHSIMPKLEPISANSFFTRGRSVYAGEFSSDLTNGVLNTYTNVSGDTNLEYVTNLYLRRDLETPGAGDYQTLTICSICTKQLVFSQAPRLVGASANYDHVAFEAWARLTTDAPSEPESCVNEGQECAPLLYEWENGVVRYVGVLPASEGGEAAPRSIGGRSGTGQPEIPNGSVSEDGSRVLFTVPSANYAPAGPLYMRIDHSSTARISASENEGEPDPNASAVFQAASSDLSKVFFTSGSQLTDTPGSGLYLYDSTKPEGHHLTLIGPGTQDILGASNDGEYVYFITGALLLPGQEAFPAGVENGIYLWHAGTISLVGSLNSFDASYGDGVGIGLDGGGARVTPDGKHLLFTSQSGAGLAGFQGCEGCAELYLYSADNGSLVCASCNPTGGRTTAEASFTMSTRQGGVGNVPHVNHPLSDDGRYVFFTTGERLVPEDHNGSVLDVYEFDSQTNEVHLISSGEGDQASYFMEASANGHDVFFTTFDRLVGWDIDNANDLYDARVGGGFPTPARPVECEGDACSTPFATPSDTTPSSSTFSGPGNQQAEGVSQPKAKPKPKAKKKKKAKKRHRHIHQKSNAKKAKRSQSGRTHR
jgi:hypothetical protein